MKNTKIVLVAEWDGWCGACAAERPLVLTRTGRQRLGTWLTGAAGDRLPLVLTCRLCGTGVDVPPEQDDPPVALTEEEPESHAEPTLPVEAEVRRDEAAAAALPAVPVQASAAELAKGRQAVAQALGALLGQRSAATTAPLPVAAPAAAPALPLQRTAPSGGLAELQMLADGIDLLSSGRA